MLRFSTVDSPCMLAGACVQCGVASQLDMAIFTNDVLFLHRCSHPGHRHVAYCPAHEGRQAHEQHCRVARYAAGEGHQA